MSWRRLAVMLTCLVGTAVSQSVVSDVLASSHNLSSTGPGPVTSSETRPCVLCHISHSGYTLPGYLWNHRKSPEGYTPYGSPTMNVTTTDPAAGTSKLCLSCHDGQVALGDTLATGTIAVSGSMAAGDTTGLNLAGHHPIGIRPVDDGQLYAGLAQTPAVSSDPAVKLPNNLVECISCHDPHKENIDAVRRRFLVRSNANSALCLACHDPSRFSANLLNMLNGWTASAHQSATNSRSEYYGNVGADACMACHLPHSSAAAIPLLRASEENACSVCHAGSGTTPSLVSVMAEFTGYAHPTTTLSGLHKGNENAYPLNTDRHAECPDCHNPHAAKPSVTPSTPPPNPPAVTPALIGATGVDAASGTSATPRLAVNAYEICFKCHANSGNKPQSSSGYSAYGRMPWRQVDSLSTDPNNTRLEFNSTVSRHNVTNPRQRTSAQVPSLRASMFTLTGAAGGSLASGTYIFCTDCHNNDSARNDGGTSASGPHGSNWPHILERRYDLEAAPSGGTGGSTGVSYVSGLNGSAALCYKCHNIDTSILQNQSFGRHSLHIQGTRAACSTCHDPHGINGGTSTNNLNLVNFDLTIVGPNSSGILRFESTGIFHGRCYLRCHGQNHNPETY